MYAELEQKVCSRCKVAKIHTEYSARTARWGGKASWCKECLNRWRTEHREKNREKYQEYEFVRGLRRNYGMTKDEYLAMWRKQKGKCACCGVSEKKFKRKLHVDHDHKTGIVRGLLCTRCNPGIGYFDHSVDRLKQAIKYLRKFKK